MFAQLKAQFNEAALFDLDRADVCEKTLDKHMQHCKVLLAVESSVVEHLLAVESLAVPCL